MGLLDGIGRHLGGVLAPLFDEAVLHRVGPDGTTDEPVRGTYRSEPQKRWMRRQASSSTAFEVA